MHLLPFWQQPKEMLGILIIVTKIRQSSILALDKISVHSDLELWELFWSLYFKKDTMKLQKVKRRAAEIRHGVVAL